MSPFCLRCGHDHEHHGPAGEKDCLCGTCMYYVERREALLDNEIPIYQTRPLRLGRHRGRNVYLQLGDEPDDLDPFLLLAETPDVAAFLVALHGSNQE